MVQPCNNSSRQKALFIFTDLAELLKNKSLWTLFLSTQLSNNSIQKAFVEMKSHIPASLGSYKTALKALLAYNDFSGALALFKQMENDGVEVASSSPYAHFVSRTVNSTILLLKLFSDQETMPWVWISCIKCV